MRAIGLGITTLLASWAMPVQAQTTGLPLWLVGTWCGDIGGAGADGHAGAELCDVWTIGKDGRLENRVARPDDGNGSDRGSTGFIAIEAGRLVLRGGVEGLAPVDYGEVSRGGQEVVFVNRASGRMLRLSLRRDGDDLIEELWFAGRDGPQRTIYHKRK